MHLHRNWWLSFLWTSLWIYATFNSENGKRQTANGNGNIAVNAGVRLCSSHKPFNVQSTKYEIHKNRIKPNTTKTVSNRYTKLHIIDKQTRYLHKVVWNFIAFILLDLNWVLLLFLLILFISFDVFTQSCCDFFLSSLFLCVFSCSNIRLSIVIWSLFSHWYKQKKLAKLREMNNKREKERRKKKTKSIFCVGKTFLRKHTEQKKSVYKDAKQTTISTRWETRRREKKLRPKNIV